MSTEHVDQVGSASLDWANA